MKIGRPYKMGLMVMIAVSGCMVLMQNCGSTNSFSPDNAKLFSMELDGLDEVNALVYGSSSDDRVYLQRKLAGYAAPGLSEIFQTWRRMSNGDLYTNGNIVPESAYNFCFTGIDPVAGNWQAGVDDKGVDLKNPGTSNKCYSSSSFTASSWIFMNNRQALRCPTNSGRYIGFISNLKFDTFVHQAVLTSTSTDDDSIALVIAAKLDGSGNLHTLSAVRSHGDSHTNQNKLGWTVSYRKNGLVIKDYGAKSVGGVFQNGIEGKDNKGWNNRKTLVRVERVGNIVRAYASVWGTEANALAVSPSSAIEIDLKASSNSELNLFVGPQHYGYATLSQAGAEFMNISFNAQTDDEYVYDLQNKLVYKQQKNGTYSVVPGADLYKMLGAPIKAGNVETQKRFYLKTNSSFEAI